MPIARSQEQPETKTQESPSYMHYLKEMFDPTPLVKDIPKGAHAIENFIYRNRPELYQLGIMAGAVVIAGSLFPAKGHQSSTEREQLFRKQALCIGGGIAAATAVAHINNHIYSKMGLDRKKKNPNDQSVRDNRTIVIWGITALSTGMLIVAAKDLIK